MYLTAVAGRKAYRAVRGPASGRRSKGKQLSLEPLEQRLALTVLPTGFTETLVTTNSNLSNPTAMEFSPTGELWVLEQAGDVELIRDDGSSHTALDITVDSDGERGLLGIAFDPAYDGAGPHQDFVYLYYTKPRTDVDDPANNQLVRYEVSGAGTATPSLIGEQIIRELPPEDEDNNPATNGNTNHNGGAIHFGPDGKLYVAVGDHNYDPPSDEQATHPSQRLDTPFGKMLRLNPDGTNPADNPLYTGSSDDWQGSIWALGLRNPYTFAIDPADGRVFINDVGEGAWEEINFGVPGANYGWAGSNGPRWEGFENDDTPPPWDNYHDPIMAYNHDPDDPTPAAVDITGGAFYPANSQFGAAFAGKYFFADAGANFIRYFDPDDPGSLAQPDTSSDFASDMTTFGPVDLKIDAEGNLYYLALGGEVHRISFTGTYGPTDVVGRHIFYNESSFDGGDPAIGPADDAAIAPKQAYTVGDGLAVADNITSYSRGINGIMIDLAGNHGPLSESDFEFRIGNSNAPGEWTLAPDPSGFAVRSIGESTDRVTFTWPTGAISNTWLEVRVLGNDDTGLSSTDVFYWGNKIGDSASSSPPDVFRTDTTDAVQVIATLGGERPISDLRDYNRDGQVNTTDFVIPIASLGTIVRLNLGGAPQAAETAEGSLAIATALAIAGQARESTVPEARHTDEAARSVASTPARDWRPAPLEAESLSTRPLSDRAAASDVALTDELLGELLDPPVE